jgi:hypothetical protein
VTPEGNPPVIGHASSPRESDAEQRAPRSGLFTGSAPRDRGQSRGDCQRVQAELGPVEGHEERRGDVDRRLGDRCRFCGGGEHVYSPDVADSAPAGRVLRTSAPMSCANWSTAAQSVYS